MQLYHPGGVIRIPARLDVSSWDLHDYLISRLPPPGSTGPGLRAVGPAPPRRATQSLQPAEKVFVFPLARSPALIVRSARHLLVGRGGGRWTVDLHRRDPGGHADRLATEEVWIGGGVLLLLLGGLFAFLFSRSSGAGRVKDLAEFVSGGRPSSRIVRGC